MKKIIATLALASMAISPVMATERNYNVVDPASKDAPRLDPATVQTPNTRGTDPADQRFVNRAVEKKSGKPHPEFWLIAVPAVLLLVGQMVFGPNPNPPMAGQPTVNQP